MNINRKKLLAMVSLALFPISLVLAVGTSLDTEKEKYSYAIGVNFAQSLMRQGAPLDADAVYMGVNDVLSDSELRLDANTISAVLRNQAQKVGERKKQSAAVNLLRGREYMERNGKKASVTTLPNGIQYEVLRQGSGKQPSVSSTVRVHYSGSLVDGREFDSSKRRGEPAEFAISDVIKGWQYALPLMREGSRWSVSIPPEFAYGIKGAGSTIGPNETLVFEIDLLNIIE